ncbi:MAG: glycosyltransferase family 2 protein [Actinomycetota bacterium]
MEGKTDAGTVSAEPLVSVIIVLYNSGEFIEPCLNALAASRYREFEVIMVDNGSTDGSARTARLAAEEAGIERVLVSRLARNAGFAAANNRGAGLADGEILLLLNPDTEVYEDTIGEFVEACRPSDVGVVGCKVYYPDGRTIQHAGGYIRDNGLTMHYGVDEEDTGQYDRPAEVAYVTGAAFAVRRDVFFRAGGLDEGYFPAYFEETDLCLKVRRMGFRVLYHPRPRVMHHESVTTGKFTRRYYYLYHRNRVRFMLKNFSLDFLLNRAWPMEERWLGMIEMEDQAIPLNKAYLMNLVNLPRTLLARRRTDRLVGGPRIEDTVSSL